ncbi:hypothetical protein THRCLA_11094 [Thraustotheca clavata]|uniref:tRNA (guanine(46)-N(7))-methyltransferase n=1 Tax=Thraustotheca clavata TaxID=74557 RepID=A0A1V9Y8W4_9STRA|nr:hypothetical protein THRCLA_11094 [Thraustotheca clavata]
MAQAGKGKNLNKKNAGAGKKAYGNGTKQREQAVKASPAQSQKKVVKSNESSGKRNDGKGFVQKRKAGDWNEKQAKKPKVMQKKKKDNPETVKLNKEIAQYASRKQYQEANEVYERARSKKLANSYTYVNMMNVCVRCGDLNQAFHVFTEMKNAKIEPDVVAYTTLLKGLCGEGKLTEALKYVKEMEIKRVPLNIRTVNTILRGCILVGAIAEAEKIFDDLTKWKVLPDASTWEYMISLCSRNLQLKKAMTLFGKGLLALGKDVAENPNILLSIARGATLLGDWTNAQKYMAMTKNCLNILDAQKDNLALSAESSSTTTTEGGKRGWGSQSDTRQESLMVFLKHRREEVRRELTLIQSYYDAVKDADENLCSTLFDSYKRVFLIPIVQSTSELQNALGNGVLDTMGLRAVLKKYDAEKIESVVSKFESRLRENVIRMNKVFGKKNKKPVKLEVCSGAGEWIVSQAKKDDANWVALEIRHDRTYQIFTQAVFEQVDNLCIIGGDATKVIPNHLTAELVDFMFINFPEPPQQTGGDSSQAKHLLTKEFFGDCVRLLKPKGRLTIVTDNKWYAQMLLKIISQVNGIKGVILSNGNVVETMASSFHLYLGDPPKECGVADTKSSSYFDRLAKQDSRRASQGTHFISIYRK